MAKIRIMLEEDELRQLIHNELRRQGTVIIDREAGEFQDSDGDELDDVQFSIDVPSPRLAETAKTEPKFESKANGPHFAIYNGNPRAG